MKKEITFPDALTYPMAKLLIEENHEICPCCGSAALIATDIGETPPGRRGWMWTSYFSAQIVCLKCNCIWTLRKSFEEYANSRVHQDRLKEMIKSE